MNLLAARASFVIPLAVLLGLPLTSCQRYEPVIPNFSSMERPACASLEPVEVELLEELAREDCDHAGQILIFPDGAEIEATGFGAVSSTTERAPGHEAVYTIRNYGGAGVMASWTQCAGDQTPTFYGDPAIIKRTLKVLGPNETAPNRCRIKSPPATSD